jgi:hypothetical protein
MDKAQLVEYNLDIVLGCPECDYLFSLSNYSIPTEGSTYHVCENCQIPLEVKPISIKIKFKKTAKLKNKDRKEDCRYGANKRTVQDKGKKKNNSKYRQQNKAVQKAKVAIKSCGFTERQFYNAFNQVEGLYEPEWEPINAENLVKEVLARIDNKYESTKT